MSITTKLGADKIILNHFKGEEKLNGLYEFDLELYIPYDIDTKNYDLDFTKLIETEATITLTLGKKIRYFHGLITQLMQGPTIASGKEKGQRTHERTYFYAKLRPTTWLMQLTENCEIHQKKSAMDIIKELLGKHKIVFKDLTAKRGKEIREYCVQYNESDFSFISRLMENEGIYYFFKHEKGKHTIYLADGGKPWEKHSDTDLATVSVYNAQHPTPVQFSLYDIRLSRQIVPSSFTYNDYDFEKPTTKLKAESKGEGKGRDFYHYPGKYIVQKNGVALTDMRLEALEHPSDAVYSKSDIPNLEIGHSFKLDNALRKDLNKKEFVIFSIHHDAQIQASPEENDEGEKLVETQYDGEVVYENNICFFSKDLPYRPPLKTPWPKIHSTQTATVSGKAKEEIWTDKYGRVQVKFHWDLSTTKDDKVSCFVRVAQAWTGKQWGILFTPRVGQEVVVSFLNGNPDEPLITGCVYNGTNLPPYLPAEKTKSTIKTNTSPDGGGFNELRFEDKKDAEEVFVHAQKDYNTTVLNGERTVTIEGEKDCGHDKLTIRKGDRTFLIEEGNQTDTLKKGNRTTTLEKGNDTETLKDGNQTITLEKGNQTITLKKGDQTVDIKGNQTIKMSGNQTMTIDGNRQTTIKGNDTTKVTGNMTMDVTGNITAKSKGKVTIDAMGDITIKTAAGTIKISASGQIDIKGPTGVGIDGAAKVDVKTTGMLTVKSSGMGTIQATMLTVKGDAMATFEGGAMAMFKGGGMATLQSGGIAAVKGSMVMLG
jgi:type VI secretion system secreted protein VgrG